MRPRGLLWSSVTVSRSELIAIKDSEILTIQFTIHTFISDIKSPYTIKYTYN